MAVAIVVAKDSYFINKIIIITDYYNDSSLNSVRNGTN